MAARKICSYCGKKLEGKPEYVSEQVNEAEAYCSAECRKKHKEALQKVRKNMKWFAAGIVCSVLLVLGSAFMEASENSMGHYMTGTGMFLLGLTLVLFPYCTPETYAMFGYVKTNRIGRALGILTALFSLWIFCKN